MNLNTNGLYWLSPLALAVTLAACGGNGAICPNFVGRHLSKD